MTVRCTKPVRDTHVLIVEDEPRLRDVLLSSVHEIGFRGSAVRSGEDALAFMENEPADIAVLDLNLPCMDGLRCFEILNERWPETAVIILTGFGTLQAAQRAIRLGVVDFLTKPASLGELEQALHRAWRQRFEVRSGVSHSANGGATAFDTVQPSTATPQQTIKELERRTILAALARHQGNREAAAAELGISVRKLYYRLAEYQIDKGME